MTFREHIVDKATRSANTPLMLFIGRYNPNSKIHYIFCESTDDIGFYNTVAYRAPVDARFSFIPCFGKNGVYDVRKRIKRGKYDGQRISYVVDADHDRFLGWSSEWGADVFVTDYYSVESYLIDEAVFVGCLRQHANLQADDPILATARNWYRDAFESFVDAMAPSMAMAIFLRRRHGPHAFHFGGIQLHLFLRRSDTWKFQQSASLAERVLELVDDVDREEALAEATKIERVIRSRNPRTWIRGKYLSWFFAQIFNAAAKALKDCRDQNEQPIRCRLQLGASQFVPVCTPQAPLPNRFKCFLIRRTQPQVDGL